MKRGKSLDLVRCVACIMIVLFHFMVHDTWIYPQIESSNANPGELGVSMFFILSGATLYISTSRYKKFRVGNYIYKRFKAIIPPFWIAFVLAFLFWFWIRSGIAPDVPKYRIYLSIFGMDGFTLYALPNYYCVGEWFIGAIIIVYIYFPFFKLIIDKWPKYVWAIILVAYIVFEYTYCFDMVFLRNPFARALEVMFGIYYAKYAIFNPERKKKLRITMFVVCLIVFTLLLVFKVSNKHLENYAVIIMGISLFYIIAQLEFVMKNMAVNKVVTTISADSYYIFLVHHTISSYLAEKYVNVPLSKAEYFACFALYIVLIVPCTLVVKYASKKLIELIEMIPQKIKV